MSKMSNTFKPHWTRGASEYLTHELQVRSDRITLHKGVVNTSQKDILFKNVLSMEYRRGCIDALLGKQGVIMLDTAGHPGYDLVLEGYTAQAYQAMYSAWLASNDGLPEPESESEGLSYTEPEPEPEPEPISDPILDEAGREAWRAYLRGGK